VFTVAYYVGTGPTSTNDGFKTIVFIKKNPLIVIIVSSQYTTH